MKRFFDCFYQKLYANRRPIAREKSAKTFCTIKIIRDILKPEGIIMKLTSVTYLKTETSVKLVAQTDKPCYAVSLEAAGEVFADAFNIEEPYDRKTHVFYVPQALLAPGMTLGLRLKKRKRGKAETALPFRYEPVFTTRAALAKQSDNGVMAIRSDRERVAPGVVFTRWTGEDKDGRPVNWFTLEVEPRLASLYVGTPGDGYQSTKVKAKVPEMIDAAVKNGVDVVAAMNADFFDMFGDCHPSGLCVKNGAVIAGEHSPRPFIGIKKDGTAVLTDLTESPALLPELVHAAAGLQLIVKDGKLHDFAPLEPFGYVRHPRTAAGIRKDGGIILLAVDGRIPEYSNGASLVDLAKIMIGLGADRALNLDGGGSTIVYTKTGTGFMLRNCPADLFRPRAMLIRKEFNALLVTSGQG